MSKKLSSVQLRMAALGNHMMEAGAEMYENPRVVRKIKNNIKENKSQKES